MMRGRQKCGWRGRDSSRSQETLPLGWSEMIDVTKCQDVQPNPAEAKKRGGEPRSRSGGPCSTILTTSSPFHLASCNRFPPGIKCEPKTLTAETHFFIFTFIFIFRKESAIILWHNRGKTNATLSSVFLYMDPSSRMGTWSIYKPLQPRQNPPSK